MRRSNCSSIGKPILSIRETSAKWLAKRVLWDIFLFPLFFLFLLFRCYAATGRQVGNFVRSSGVESGTPRRTRSRAPAWIWYECKYRGGVEDSRNLKPPTSFRRRTTGSRREKRVRKGSLPIPRVTALSTLFLLLARWDSRLWKANVRNKRTWFTWQVKIPPCRVHCGAVPNDDEKNSII